MYSLPQRKHFLWDALAVLSVVNPALSFFLVRMCLWSIPAWPSASSMRGCRRRGPLFSLSQHSPQLRNLAAPQIVGISNPSLSTDVQMEAAGANESDWEEQDDDGEDGDLGRPIDDFVNIVHITRKYSRNVTYFFCDFRGVSEVARVDFAHSGGTFDGDDGARDAHYCGGGGSDAGSSWQRELPRCPTPRRVGAGRPADAVMARGRCRPRRWAAAQPRYLNLR
ncbi:hypothetical protein FB451DRAFT_1176746 [Mycena latifolia]|nr:hypothetical protein FB451DRAFT_1176746 [Mycena latifolia]